MIVSMIAWYCAKVALPCCYVERNVRTGGVAAMRACHCTLRELEIGVEGLFREVAELGMVESACRAPAVLW